MYPKSRVVAPIIAIIAFSATSRTMAQRFTTVQLPTIQNFSMSTTVVVPDRGRTYAGGVNRSFRSSSRRGAPLFPSTNRSFRGGAASSGVSVSAYIHDLEEMDDAVLSEWQRIKSQRSQLSTRPARHLSNPVAAKQVDHRLPRVSDLRRKVEAEAAANVMRAKREYDSAVRLEQKGELAAAKSRYRNAFKRADSRMREQIVARMTKLGNTKQK